VTAGASAHFRQWQEASMLKVSLAKLRTKDHDHRSCSCDDCRTIRLVLVRQHRGSVVDSAREVHCAVCGRSELVDVMSVQGSVVLCPSCAGKPL
jgi:hypothetical protein